MTADQTQALEAYFAPTFHGIFPGMPTEKYRAIPAFNPSLIKLGVDDVKSGGARGHITRILDRIENEDRISRGELPLPGFGDNGSKAKDFGSVYHQLLLEPDSFGDRFTVLTPEIKEQLLEIARKRKIVAAPALSSRTKEWQAFKKQNHRDPNLAEQAELQKARDAAVGEGTEWHSRLTEFSEWVEEQRAAGKKVVTEDEIGIARTMAEAIYDLPENREVADFLRSEAPIEQERVECSLFARLKFQTDGTEVGIKGRPDIIPASDCFLDPKSCQSVHPYDFARTVDSLGYAIQAGAYVLMSELLAEDPLAERFNFPKQRFGFIAQESTRPFLAKLWWLPDNWLAYGKQQFLTMIRNVQHAKNTGNWGGTGEFQFSNQPDPQCPGETLEPPMKLMVILEHF